MTIKEFHKLRFGNVVYHEGFERMFLVIGWSKGKKTKTKTLILRPSLLSVKRVYITENSAFRLKHTQI